MGKMGRELLQEHIQFIQKQHLFFVATAPSDDGRINLSPKGYDSLHIVDSTKLLYLDYAGSGNETANHIRDNGKITLMWCSFDDNPLILRVYGYGKVFEKGTPEYDQHMDTSFPAVNKATARQVMLIELEAMQTSCGYGVPIMTFAEERSKLQEWSEMKANTNQLDEYIEKNAGRLDYKFPVVK